MLRALMLNSLKELGIVSLIWDTTVVLDPIIETKLKCNLEGLLG